MNDFNFELCEEKHKTIDKEMGTMWKRIDEFSDRLDGYGKVMVGVLVGIIFNLAGIIAIFLKVPK